MISFAKVTSEAYAGLTPVEDRIYYLTDTGEMYLNGDLFSPDLEPAIDALNNYFGGDPLKKPLTITIADPSGANTISLYRASTSGNFDMEWSRDGRTWTPFAFAGDEKESSGVAIGNGAASNSVMVRGHNPHGLYDYGNLLFHTSSADAGDAVKLSGNMHSTLIKYGWWTIDDLSAFRPGYPYQYMFYYVFNNYTSYRDFYHFNCSDAGDLLLPATKLGSFAYLGMFYASNITRAPQLPATVLGNACYQSMFFRCANLSSVSVGFTSWASNPAETQVSPTASWLNGVAQEGTFRCPSALDTTIARGMHTIPDGWTIETY